MEPFGAQASVPSGTNAKLPNDSVAQLPSQQLSAAERLQRLEEAKAFLRQHLAAGPQPARTLLTAAKSAGIAERTLHRAKDVLSVTTERAGGYAGHGQWVWHPPTRIGELTPYPLGRRAKPRVFLPRSVAQ